MAYEADFELQACGRDFSFPVADDEDFELIGQSEEVVLACILGTDNQLHNYIYIEWDSRGAPASLGLKNMRGYEVEVLDKSLPPDNFKFAAMMVENLINPILILLSPELLEVFPCPADDVLTEIVVLELRSCLHNLAVKP